MKLNIFKSIISDFAIIFAFLILLSCEKSEDQQSNQTSLFDLAPAKVSKRFKVKRDVIIDTQTDLMWIKSARFGGSKNWYQATKYCDNLIYAGYSDWRLPNIKELKLLFESLLDYNNADAGMVPELDHPFIGVNMGEIYWSSTENAFNTEEAYGYFTSFDNYSAINKIISCRIWPVRSY